MEDKQTYLFIFYTPHDKKEFFRIYVDNEKAVSLNKEITFCLNNKSGIKLANTNSATGVTTNCTIPYGLLNNIYFTTQILED